MSHKCDRCDHEAVFWRKAHGMDFAEYACFFCALFNSSRKWNRIEVM